MAFVWGTEMLKSLKIKWMTVDLAWLYNTFDKGGFHLHQVTTWKNQYTIKPAVKYASIKMMTIAQALFFQ